MALKLPGTGMATAVDVGNPHDIHPTDKTDVGHRLALAAEHVAYGADVVYSGPTYQSMKVEGANVLLKFEDVGKGLKIGRPPEAFGASDVPTDRLVGFAVAGVDRVFHWAEGRIEGETVVLSSAQVPAPVAVRYGWANCPVMNLYSEDGLPALPFRTDSWPVGEEKWK